MIFEQATSLYVPVFFVLLQSKSYITYWTAIHLCICASEWKFEAKSITSDGEKALRKAQREQFPDAVEVACLFHFKQDLRRRLLHLGLSKDRILEFLGEFGIVNTLTIIPIPEMVLKGIYIA